MIYEVVRHPSAARFLERAGSWLLRAEDRHNLILGIAYASAAANGDGASDAHFATVERAGRVHGCCVRVPPHQVLLTDLPGEAVDVVVEAVSVTYASVPAVLGPAEIARSFAQAWVGLHGGRAEPGTDQRLYRLDEVTAVPPAPGRLRPAEARDGHMALAWGGAFARETHVLVGPDENTMADWIEKGRLWVWEDGDPACMAVAHGRTPRGIRIGFVYTPPERRRRGYAAACVAELSRRMLASGLEFCVLYADLSNPTTNALYQRIGYRHVTDVRDYYFHPEEPS